MFALGYTAAADSRPKFPSLRLISRSFTSHLCFSRFSLRAREEKKSLFLNSPVGVKNKSLLYVSPQPAKDSAEEGMATAAPSQSSPKTTLEGDTG